MKYQLFQEVVLRKDIPWKKLKEGDVGTIVEYHPFKGEDGYSVEIFNALGESLMLDIVEIQLDDLISRIDDQQGISLEINYDVKEFLAEKGFDPSFGARPLRRAIQRYLQNPLAEFLLSNHNDGSVHLEESLNNGIIRISKI